MIIEAIGQLGAWSWMIAGLVLLVLEIVAPGFFFLWPGISALVVGAISLVVWGYGADLWTWQVQLLAFLVLSVGSAYLGRSWLLRNRSESDEPLLNARTRQLVGRTATLEKPIVDGHGSVRIGDTYWRVEGPDLPAGSRVRISGATADSLQVEGLSESP